MLYHIDNLNVATETANQILTKEKIDKQKTGQPSITPFMKTGHDKSKKSKKGVSFRALETKDTIDKHSSSIDKLTSSVNKLDMKLDRQESQYRPQYIRIEIEDNHKDKATMSIEIGSIVKIGTNPIEVEEISSTIIEVIGPTLGIEVDQGTIGMEIVTGEAIMPRTIEEIIIDRTMVIKGTGIQIEV